MLLTKQKLYSYIRWSSDNKFGYNTFIFQLQTTKEITQVQDLELVEMLDSGISAFKSNNLKNNILGELKC
jgi:hypothetical protein